MRAAGPLSPLPAQELGPWPFSLRDNWPLSQKHLELGGWRPAAAEGGQGPQTVGWALGWQKESGFGVSQEQGRGPGGKNN